MVAASRQSNTIRAYIGSYHRFELWASDIEELSVFPSNELALTIYILSLIQSGKSISTIQQFIFAASWLHSTGGYDNPTKGAMIRTVLEGAKRSLTKPPSRKEPITSKMLYKIQNSLMSNQHGMSLKDKRTLTFMVITYAGIFRSEESLKIRRCDVAFHASYLAIFVEKSKTDVYRNGNTILIARTGTSLDPVNMLYQYFQAAGIEDKSKEYIFRRVSKATKALPMRLRSTDKHISYTTMKEDILREIAIIGLDPARYGTHSLRAGGATAAANNGTSDRMLKVHGRWKTDSSKDRYVQDSIHRRLKITLNLGL